MTKVWIDGYDAEAWLPQREVTGGFGNLPQGASLFVRVNNTDVVPTISGTSFSATIDLAAGENTIGAGFQDENGKDHVLSQVKYVLALPDQPQARIQLEFAGATIKVSGLGSSVSEVSDSPLQSYTWSVRSQNPASLSTDDNRSLDQVTDSEFTLVAPTIDGEYYIQLIVDDVRGKSDRSETYFVVESGVAREVNWAIENARWVEDAVVYGVVPHNFGSEGFRSVTSKLDYLKDLGINAIWLAPANLTPAEGGHSYNVSDYFELRPDYGTKEEFRELIKEAHDRGIKVLMDYVPNHTAYEHRYFQHALEYGKSSPYYGFYDRDENGVYTYYFDWPHLPNLNYDNPEVVRWMVEAISYWIREFDIDGYRVDAIWGVRQRRPDFWPMMRTELQRIKPDMVLIAEASARDPYYVEQGFDSAYDWSDELGHWAWENVFVEPQGIARRLHAELTNHGKGYAPDTLTFRFLNNNDTSARFLTRYGADLKRTAAALVLTLDGIPCLYTGEENGIEFEPYYTPDPISFEDLGYREYYTKLVQIRNEQAALRTRNIEVVTVTDDVYGYSRYLSEQESNLVWINFSGAEQVVDVKLPEEFASWMNGQVKNLLTGETVNITEQMTLAPWDVLILARP